MVLVNGNSASHATTMHFHIIHIDNVSGQLLSLKLINGQESPHLLLVQY